jgi:DHA3 family multidrug efflux protein-like MFS transporter
MIGVVIGNIRTIALPPLVTVLIPEKTRDKANGLVGSATGVAFLVTSVISGLLVGISGMFLVLLLAIIVTVLSIVHLLTIDVPENKVIHIDTPESPTKMDIKGTIKIVKAVPGLLALILFSTFNNFLGGVFMALMDAYGLSLVSVEIWGLLWGVLSTAFIIGGLIIAKVGLGKKPLRALFVANIVIWTISSVFTIQSSVILLVIGMFIYLAVVPFIEAAEHTIIQKAVPVDRQGRVFGFAQSIEQAASPLTAFLIGPIAQFIFIPFMTTGRGAELIGSWYGTGDARGIALVFTITGIIGLLATIAAMNSPFYKRLSKEYAKK